LNQAHTKLLLAQAGLAAATALIFLFWKGSAEALAALFGGGIVLINSILLAWRVRRAAGLEGNSVVLAMYLGAVERFVVVGACFALGIGVLSLPPVPMIAAFAVGLIGFAYGAHTQQQS